MKSKSSSESIPSYFPIRVQYTNTNDIRVHHDPTEIRSGEGFKVLETRVPPTDKVEVKVPPRII